VPTAACGSYQSLSYRLVGQLGLTIGASANRQLCSPVGVVRPQPVVSLQHRAGGGAVLHAPSHIDLPHFMYCTHQ